MEGEEGAKLGGKVMREDGNEGKHAEMSVHIHTYTRAAIWKSCCRAPIRYLPFRPLPGCVGSQKKTCPFPVLR